MIAGRAMASTASPAPRRVPEAFLRAEIAAFPLVGEESFRRAMVMLDPYLGSGGETAAVWRECESALVQHTGWSLDRLVGVRDRTWFGVVRSSHGAGHEDLQPVPLITYLRRLAAQHLQRRPGVTRIEESTEEGALDAEIHYRWLTFSLPEDLLLAALDVDPAPVRVELDPPLLVRRLLDSGVAEVHQHVGAGMDFPMLWASALAALATPAIREDLLVDPGAPFSDGKWLVRWLLAAAIARCVLAEYLACGLVPSRGRGLMQFLERRTKPSLHSAWTSLRRSTLANVIMAIAWGDSSRIRAIELDLLRDLYAELHPFATTLNDHPIDSVADAYQRCDPVAARFGLRGTNAGERWWLRAAFEHLRHIRRPGGDGGDELFERVFWQTVRVRCQYYRTIVQRPLTGGLQWFIRFYHRIGPLRRPLEPIRAEASYEVVGAGESIAAFEIRTSAGDTSIATAEELVETARSWMHVVERSPTSELAVVLHFVKDRDEGFWSRGAPPAFWARTYAEPEPEREGGSDAQRGRYIRFFTRQARKARAVAELVRDLPCSLWLLRGLDVAGDELGIPTWVLAPLFRYVVETSLASSLASGGARPLRLTAHVGEDFRHLMEGLRRIYEQVYYVLGGDGGRLGHAIALGIDPQSWGESVGSVLYPAEERLWDLVFEWRLYTRYRIPPEFGAEAPLGRPEQIQNMLSALSSSIFGRAYEAQVLAEAHHTLHRFLVPPMAKEDMAVQGGFDTFQRGLVLLDWGRVHFGTMVRKVLHDYFEYESVFQNGQNLVDVPIDSTEIEALSAVQLALRRGICQRGIVVEVNPSSNLLIADLLDLRHHPILRLFPPEQEPGAPPRVPIALGSDDPVTFNTRLVREYTLLHRAACAAGYSERVIQEWLGAIRQTGMDARFSFPWRPNAVDRVRGLLAELERYLHVPRDEALRGRGRRVVGR